MKRRGIRRQRDDEEHSLPAEQKDHQPPRSNLWSSIRRRLLALFLGFSALAAIYYRCTRTISFDQSHLHENSSMSSRRFPKYGTKEFTQQCNWTMIQKQEDADCNLLLRPEQGSREGIADWIARASTGYILSKETGCQLLMDYGDDVDIHQVLMPLSTDWTIPHGFQCTGRCIKVSGTQTISDTLLHSFGKTLGRRVIRVPSYRHAYVHRPYLHLSMFPDLQVELPSFDLESGMACSLGSLFDLSPSASQFEPDLFTRLLPALRDEKALVIAIYFRSGLTDRMAEAEKNGTQLVEITGSKFEWLTKLYRTKGFPGSQCALRLEQEYLSDAGNLSRIIWMVVTDDAHLKKWIRESSPRESDIFLNQNASVSRREILTTESRGVQTRKVRNPSTADFAEALIDWYLIGESDLVVTSHAWYSFGATASLRTVRPFYDATNCSLLPRFGPAQ